MSDDLPEYDHDDPIISNPSMRWWEAILFSICLGLTGIAVLCIIAGL